MDHQPQPALSDAMREGSRLEHEEAEASPFVSDLVGGRARPAQYAAYLRRLRVVYAALEDAVRDRREHPAVAGVHDDALTRSDALEADLAHWAPGREPAVASPAAEAYCARIEAARLRPHLLVAHHYTRYLGDLSGGRVLAQALRREYADQGLESAGLAFYDFPEIPKPVPYKRDYRDRLDALPLSDADRAEVVEEVRQAFRLNRDLFAEVADPHVDAETDPALSGALDR
ncbi:heme oxygenase [Nocardioides ginsengisegetis]|uniref:heme oxygenase (biliverdin-producing) n=1 Tax=Nocardioides ginsengisegetis TaxID=661491 RepID=A0A7W3J2Y6_9ACTN|nr:heme oxygenase [Nocardioides ginsengisegetis]